MKVFVAGATGVLGREAVKRLLEAGHGVTGIARTDEKAESLRTQGAGAARIDLFDPDAVRSAVAGHDVVCNLATHIPSSAKAALRGAWRDNDRLHTLGARNLVDAAMATGASRYLQHSSGFMYADGGDRWLDEDSPIEPPPHGVCILEAERQTRRFADADGTGIALRFGFFYGPTAFHTVDFIKLARRLRIALPVAGSPHGYYPSIHTDDLGTAVVAALHAPSGAHNVHDDEPLTRREFADAMARALGVAKLRVPRVPKTKRLGYISRSQRVSNRRFKEATGWAPAFPSAREGWPAVIAAQRAAG